MHHPAPDRDRPRPRRAASVASAAAALAVFTLALTGCGASGGDSSTGPTTTAAPTTTRPKAAATTTTTAPADDEARMPVEEDDAPTGTWVAVRWYKELEPKAADFRLGSAEGRAYEITPDCDGSSCSLELGPGNGESYGMPGTQAVTGDSFVVKAESDHWTGKEVVLGACFIDGEEVSGLHLETKEVREFQPLRDEDGTIVALLGTYEFEATLEPSGVDAGCTAEENNQTGSQAVVMAPVEQGIPAGNFSLDGRFIMTSEVVESEGKTDPLAQKGALATTIERDDTVLDGTCRNETCTGTIALALGDGTSVELDLEVDDDLLVATGSAKGRCVDGTTGAAVMDDAYDTAWEIGDLFPVVVYEGQAKVLMGRLAQTSTPTAAGRTDPRCAQDEHLESWIYLVVDED